MSSGTLLDHIWDAHRVVEGGPGQPDLLYIDLHLVHEVTSPQAFATLQARGLPVRRPDLTLATMDHVTPTVSDADGHLDVRDTRAAQQIAALKASCAQHGIELLGMQSEARGIVHVVGPERGRTQPGMTIVCGDSHTSTHGAFGALAFGIGTTEIGHVLATQCLLQHRPKTMRVHLEGTPGPGTTAKDLILAVIAHIGMDGGTGHVIEYQGDAIRALSMEGRMTLCNMSIEAGARAGLIAPDETTVAYLRGRRALPSGPAFDALVERWSDLRSAPDATFDADVHVDVDDLSPRITWGTRPAQSVPVLDKLPDATADTDAAYAYMGLQPGHTIQGHPIDVVFVGSCTNGRIEDLRQAASVLKGRRIAKTVRMVVVPGSEPVRAQAEAEGLREVFVAAGAEWRRPGCSMCIAMNGDRAERGQYVASTSNRNFEGRQGPGSRTFLCSPLTAAATAVAGRVTDPRTFLEVS